MKTNLAPRRRTATTPPLAVAAVLVVLAVLPMRATRAASQSRAPAPDGRRCVLALEPGGDLEPEVRPEYRSPAAIAVDHRGDLLVADTGNHRVVVLDPGGRVLRDFGGYGWDEGQFDGPSDLSVYAGFFTYVLDRGNRRVVRFDVDGLYVDEIVSDGEAGSPVAIAVGRSGELLLVDEDSQSVLLRSQFDEQLEPFGRFGAGQGGLVRPVAIDVGPRGEIAVADPGRRAVLVFDEFGTSLYELTLPDTLSPVDVVFDGAGAVLVADSERSRIVAFPPGGGGPTASVDCGDSVRIGALALYDEATLAVLDSERGGVLFIRMTHGECGARR